MTDKKTIKQVRMAAGKTQKDCAKHLGIWRQTFSYKENGKSSFSCGEMQKLCAFLKVKIDDIMWDLS